MPLTPGDKLTNQELTRYFQVGNMGGMRRSNAQNCLVLISDPFKAIYEDRWKDDVLHYTGMGKRGDQQFVSQNKTLQGAGRFGVVVHLFEVQVPTFYTYLGEVELAGEIYTETQPDIEGVPRRVLMFPIRVKPGGSTTLSAGVIQEKENLLASAARRRNIEQLAKRAKFRKGLPGVRTVTTTQFERSQDVVEYVKRSAQGICQLCEQSAPFKTRESVPYLEVHHIVWLAEGGNDTVANAVALCPNCHRKMHVVKDSKDVTKLREIAVRTANGLERSDDANH